MRLHFKLKSPVKIDSDSIELTFTICAIMEHYKKCLAKIKKRVEWGSNHWPYDCGLMAAHKIVFYALLSMNVGFCRLFKINLVFFNDTAFISSKSRFDRC